MLLLKADPSDCEHDPSKHESRQKATSLTLSTDDLSEWSSSNVDGNLSGKEAKRSEDALAFFLRANEEEFWDWTMHDKHLHLYTERNRTRHIYYLRHPVPFDEIFRLRLLRASPCNQRRDFEINISQDLSCCLFGQYRPNLLWPIDGTSMSWWIEKSPQRLLSCDNHRASKKDMLRALSCLVLGQVEKDAVPTPAITNCVNNYFNTGLCLKHMMQFASKEGPLNCKAPRDMICLENTQQRKVFLKWCTRCKKWKNFLDFIYIQKSRRHTEHHTHCSRCCQSEQCRDVPPFGLNDWPDQEIVYELCCEEFGDIPQNTTSGTDEHVVAD